jgi:hypothetical protein
MLPKRNKLKEEKCYKKLEDGEHGVDARKD